MPDTTRNQQNPNIGHEVLHNMYTNLNFETKNPQPLFVLYRDTIRSFLHEKKGQLGVEGRLLGLLGIGATLSATLLTSTFHDFWLLSSNTIKGTFIAFLLIIVFFIIKNIPIYFRILKKNSINEMVDALGNRGSIIKSSDNTEEIGSIFINGSKSDVGLEKQPQLPVPVEKKGISTKVQLPTKDLDITDKVPEFLLGKWLHKYWDASKGKMMPERARIEKNGEYFRNDEDSPYFLLKKFNPTYAQGIITFDKVYKKSGKEHGRERLKIEENGDFLVGAVKHKDNDKREYRRML